MHPVAFEIGGFAIHWYGVFLALGVVAGVWTATRRCVLDKIQPTVITDLAPWLVGGVIVGARALFVATHWNQFAGKPLWHILNLRSGGLVFYGGLIGAVIMTYVYLRIKQLPVWRLADALAPSIALGHALGRIGCLMFGCCYGRVCELPWAIHFPEGHESHPHGVHPTQIYESLLNFGLYLALAWLYRRKKFDGQVFGAYLVSYAIVRSFVELFRGDYLPAQYHLGGWFTPAHYVSIGILGTGMLLLLRLSSGTKADGTAPLN
jgi:phosphatidylglycerol:prolipoprotein diacylglycerol transferase